MTEKPLPMGWREIAPTGIPSDAGTPPDEWTATAQPRHPREEIRCWVRGDSYVRICRVTLRDDVELKKNVTESPLAIHVGNVNDPGSDEIECHFDDAADVASAETYARRLMRIGGY